MIVAKLIAIKTIQAINSGHPNHPCLILPDTKNIAVAKSIGELIDLHLGSNALRMEDTRAQNQ